MSSRHRHPIGDLARVPARPGRRSAPPPAGRTPLLLRATVGGAVVLAVAASVIRTYGAEPAPGDTALAGRSLSPVAQNLSQDDLSQDDAGLATRGAARPARNRPSAAASCRVRYTVSSRSADRFTAVMTVVNTGTKNVNGWTLRWQDPSAPEVASSWNANVDAGDSGLQAKDGGMNRVIPAGGSTTIGFVGTGDGTVPEQPSFTLNGVACR